MKIKRILVFLLCAAFASAFLFACNKPTEKGPINGGDEEDPIVWEPGEVDIEEFTIVYSAFDPADTATEFAANELRDYIQKAANKTLTVAVDTATETENEILIGKTNRGESGSIDFDALGDEGFRLRVDGNKFLIAAASPRGALYGVYSYLELMGFRFWTSDAESLPEAGAVFVPQKWDVAEKPVFSWRDVTYDCSLGVGNSLWSAKQKINSYFTRNMKPYGGAVTLAGGDSGLVHTMKYLLPESLYFSTNPTWFAFTGSGRNRNQVCYSSADEWFDISLNIAKTWLDATPDADYISVSHNDNGISCKCPACEKLMEDYGYSGITLRFANRLAAALKESGYKAKVLYLAYDSTSAPPKGGVVPADNVAVQLAVNGCNSHPLNECNEPIEDLNRNMSQYHSIEQFETWKDISVNELHIWGYAGQYWRRVAPFPNWRSIYGNINYFAKNGADGYYLEGNDLSGNGDFGELKSYLIAKMLWNPLMSEEEFYTHMDEFLEGYYGKSGAAVRSYIDLTLEESEGVHFGSTGDLHTYFKSGKDFTKTMEFISKANAFWDKAERDCQNATYYARLERARVQMRFYELYTTMEKRWNDGNETVRAELKAANKKMYDTMKKYNLTYIEQNFTITRTVSSVSEAYQYLYNFEWSPKKFIMTYQSGTAYCNQFLNDPF